MAVAQVRYVRQAMQTEAFHRAVFIAPFVVIGILGVVVPIYLMLERGRSAVYITSPSRVTPSPTEVCPGDLLSYTVNIDVLNVPAQVMIVETVWSVDQGETVIFDEAPVWAAYTDVVHFSRVFSYFVPALDPGRYELRSVAQEHQSQPSAYSVPFTVRSSC